MTSREAADYLRISYDGFRTMRSRGQGPAVFIAIGRRLRFRKQDLDAFLTSRVQCDPRVPNMGHGMDNSAAPDQNIVLAKRKRGRPRATGQIVVMPASVYVQAGILLALAIAGRMICLLFS
ncbi:helix-turn-helix domain-containing protein [Acetobacter musti]|uniref:Helix-turn-helix domain-containing protein n=2 Tax=Acetobacter musti TaxID=864732 RepID=A0ABX0JSV7_9PROT|nr:helix-turn-helix domain-containing protein [Acetobacter musti]